MKDISIKDFQIGNDQDFTLMGGMNVLESKDLAMKVAEEFKVSWVPLVQPRCTSGGIYACMF